MVSSARACEGDKAKTAIISAAVASRSPAAPPRSLFFSDPPAITALLVKLRQSLNRREKTRKRGRLFRPATLLRNQGKEDIILPSNLFEVLRTATISDTISYGACPDNSRCAGQGETTAFSLLSVIGVDSPSSKNAGGKSGCFFRVRPAPLIWKQKAYPNRSRPFTGCGTLFLSITTASATLRTESAFLSPSGSGVTPASTPLTVFWAVLRHVFCIFQHDGTIKERSFVKRACFLEPYCINNACKHVLT